MHIVILGAGTVGTSIAESLCGDRQNVSLVDASRAALADVEEKLDVQTVCGSACDAVTLFQAGVLGCDICLAVTNLDEVNLVGASLAKAMGARRSIARVFNPTYLDQSTFDYRRHFQVDRMLSLELLTAVDLARGIRTRGLFAVENFARGGVEVQEVAVDVQSKAVGVPLKDLQLPRGVRIGVISSGGRTVIAGADDVMRPDDHVTLIGEGERVADLKKMLEHRPPPRLRVMIAGGGEIGYHLARLLQTGRFSITMLETDAARCEHIASRLDHVTVLRADATRLSELEEARAGSVDAFVAATGDDEDNLICCVNARELGCQRIMCIVRRPDYAHVLEKLGIDFAVSPREVLARQVLGLVQSGPIIARSPISSGEAEVWEVEVEPDSPITQAPLREVALPGALIAAFERSEFVRVPGAEDQLQAGDTAVVLVQHDHDKETLQVFQNGG